MLPAQVSYLLRTMDEEFGLAGVQEVAIEGAPSSFDVGKLRALRAAGVTRMSIGIQVSTQMNADSAPRARARVRACDAETD